MSPFIPFSIIITVLLMSIINYRYQLKDLILLWYFLKLLVILVNELKEIFQDKVRIFQDTYF